MAKIRAWMLTATVLIVTFFMVRGGELVNANVTTRVVRDPIAPELHQAMNGLSAGAHLRVIVTLASTANLANLELSMRYLPVDRRQGEVEKALKTEAEAVQSNSATAFEPASGSRGNQQPDPILDL